MDSRSGLTRYCGGLILVQHVNAEPEGRFLLTWCVYEGRYFYPPICSAPSRSFTLQRPWCASRDLFYIPLI